VHCGARPVFVDVDPLTLNIDPAAVAAAVTPKTKAVLPVHFGGLAADLERIREAAPGAAIIEDAAHAVGTRYRGRMVGGHGGLTCFSFYANKNLTTGEGGMLAFSDGALADRLASLRLHGLSRDAWKRYQVQALVHSEVLEPGYKYNLTDLQSSLGLHQLRKQERFLERREAIAQIYDRGFAELAAANTVRLQPRPAPSDAERHALHLYPLVLDPSQLKVDRDQVIVALRAENIGAGIHYRAVHCEPFYAQQFPVAAELVQHARVIGDNVFTVPLTPAMTDADAGNVVDAVHKVLAAYRR
jgi:dTDP-4-amino-4,6-dideoxygalactose transaminase